MFLCQYYYYYFCFQKHKTCIKRDGNIKVMFLKKKVKLNLNIGKNESWALKTCSACYIWVWDLQGKIGDKTEISFCKEITEIWDYCKGIFGKFTKLPKTQYSIAI